MATRIGIIKSISQGSSVIATAKDGTQRVLKVGDEIFLGETIQTTDFDSKVVITANDGKDIAIIGKDTLNLDKSVAHNESFGDDSVADVSAIQKALLDGANITDLEETAAGGNAAAGAGGDGVSLGAASFEEGGHYSNITDDYRNLTDSNRAFDSFNSPIGGYADANDAGAGDIGGSAANTPVAIKISLDGNGEAREATPNEYLVYNLGLSAATNSTTPTDLTLNLSGASAGNDYLAAMEYSTDGGNNWTTIQNGGTISGVAPSDIANVKVRVQVLDDYGQTAGNQNEGASSKDLGANIAPGIKDYGVYKEGVTLSVTTNNAAITSGEAEGKIIDNDDKIDITQDINPDDYEGVELTINRSFINYDPDNGNNTMKPIIDTKDGDDTITIKEGVEFRSGLSDFKDDGNDVIKMGDGDDVLNIEKSDAEINGEMKYGSVSSTKIDMGNAGGEKNQDTVIIDGGTVLNTMITSHDGNDKFTVRGDATLGDVLFKTGKGEDTVNIESGITVTSLKSVKIDTGADNDIVNIKHDLIDDVANHGSTDGSEYEGVRTASFIKTGEGNDTIKVTDASISGVDIDTGDGDLSKEPYGDTLEFISSAIRDSEIKSGNGNDNYKFENTNLDKTSVNSGEGNDTIKIGDEINMKNSSVTGGDGNDKVDLGKGVVLDNSTITGGEGTKDTLKIHDDSFKTTNAGKISGFEILDMSEFDGVFRFFQASDISNFIKNVGGEGATSLTVKGIKGVGRFEDGTSGITTSREADGNATTYEVHDGNQTFTLKIEEVNIIPTI
ncbi:hypothetical protein [uncultured Campylobacter sp.]|uniref:hypothetical protein n=1 Tax=uncultured Campylobacter sp. TaxID=218934 RepID=UPI00261E7156|nr:hypothetical protein [uncultured Campylobacter sp.]